MQRKPSYIKLHKQGIIKERIKKLKDILENCHLCPHHCEVNRIKGETGLCNSDSRIKIASYGPHYGEEAPLVGSKGSGTIFFSNCSLKCVYCQNYEISQKGLGNYIKPEELAEIMLNLQKRGCHNINFVTPTHMVYGIIKAVDIALEKSLEIPLVYNTGGYDSVNTLKLMEGIIDIYMPDVKYASNKKAEKYSNVPNYYDIIKDALIEMHKQVGDLQIKNGLAEKGLLVRHLVLPDHIAGTKDIIDFLVNSISVNTYLNLMKQYYPSFQVDKYPELNKRIDYSQYNKLLKYAKTRGLRID